jgi:hypothetical protein
MFKTTSYALGRSEYGLNPATFSELPSGSSQYVVQREYYHPTYAGGIRWDFSRERQRTAWFAACTGVWGINSLFSETSGSTCTIPLSTSGLLPRQKFRCFGLRTSHERCASFWMEMDIRRGSMDALLSCARSSECERRHR